MFYLRYYRPIVNKLNLIHKEDWFIQWASRGGLACFPMDIRFDEIELVRGKYRLKNSGRFERFVEHKEHKKDYEHRVVSQHNNPASVAECINKVASITTGNWSLYITEFDDKYCLYMFFMNENDAVFYKMSI